MKAITIWQPWAQLLVAGIKQNETRSWQTHYRGELLIHAAKQPPLRGIQTVPDAAWKKALLSLGLNEEDDPVESFPIGVIVGKVKIVDCRQIDDALIKRLSAEELAYGDFTPGRYAWVMEEPEILKQPIPAKGKQGLWNWISSESENYHNGVKGKR